MNWDIFLYVLLGILLVALIVVLVIIFIRSGMKDYLVQLIAKAEQLFPKDIPDYQKKRLDYVVEAFKAKYKWISWLINVVKFIAKFCATFKIIKK